MIDVRHLAELARLSLTEEEATALEIDLKKIVAYVDELQSIDVSGVSPTAAVIDARETRADDLIPSLSQSDALASAPESEEGAFVVPAFVSR